MGKLTSLEYLEALQEEEGESSIDPDFQNPVTLSEADRLALAADGPQLRADGKPITSAKTKRLTEKQVAFVAACVAGKTYREAYREAYPNDSSNDRAISASAYRLTQNPQIAQMLSDAFDETAENLADDIAATKLYVMRQLLALTKNAKQEGSKLKALELMGKAVGVFTHQAADVAPTATAAELKAQLSGHLKLLKG